LTMFAELDGADRGAHVMDGVLYRLIDDTLWQVSSLGAYSDRGTVSGSGRAVFADDGSNLYFTVDNKLWRWRFDTLTEVTQSVVTNPHAITYINRKFVIAGDNGLFGVSDPSDGTTYNDLNYAEAETLPDPLLRPYNFSQVVYMFGSQTTEIWQDAGAGNPPLVRQDSSLVNVGAAGYYCVTNTDQYLYWLGDDRKVYQGVGSSARNVATPEISHIIDSLSVVSDCICSTVVVEGQDFVLFKFTDANRSLLYSETNNIWTELASGTSNPSDMAYIGNEFIRCYGKNLVSTNQGVYELDLNAYLDGDAARLLIRTLPSFTGMMIGKPGNRITCGGVRINMQLGVGLATGQGSAPVLMCQFSPDGGETWQAEQFVPIGAMGDYTGPVYFYDFCTGYDVRCRIMCSDPVFISLFAGVAFLTDAGF